MSEKMAIGSAVLVCMSACAASVAVGLVVYMSRNKAAPPPPPPPGGESAGGPVGGPAGGGPAASCAANQVFNGKKCVAAPESGVFGAADGEFHENRCMPGHYVSGVNVGYDNKVKEVKYIAFGCSDGQEFKWGRNAPSGIGQAVVGALTMGMATGFFKPNTGYENQSWINPGNPGWDKVSLISSYGGKNDKFVRAFGPDPAFLFGVPQANSYNPATDVKSWACDPSNAAPAGQMYRINSIKSWTSDKGVKGLQFGCGLFAKPAA